MNEPLVSILIPTYNRENFIAETIKSAQNQSYKNLEIIVVDNFSKDKTCEIVKKIATKDKRIKLFCNESNVGPVRNWLKCINLASGQYGKFLWSDDLIHPLFVEETLSLLLKNKKLAFVYTKVEVILSKTKKKYIYNLKKSGVFNSHTYIQYVLTNFKYPKSPGCAIFRMDDLRNNLVIDIPNDLGIDFSNEAIGNDLLLFLLTLAKHPFFGYINQPYAIFRQHSNSITEFTPKSKLTILYAYAKSYFIENYVKDRKLIVFHNSYLWLLVKFFRNNSIGIKNISQFYKRNKNYNISVFSIFNILPYAFNRLMNHIVNIIYN